jgi:small subunit ribosomal protein S1
VVAIGDTVRIKVLDIDRDRQRISLGLKQTQEDPWQRVISTHRPGDVLEGTVTKVVAFGAFVEILPGVEGLVHISELADHHVESPSEVVEPGTVLNVKILEIDEERRRLSLSIKRVEGENMPMGDLGEQLQDAGITAQSDDDPPAGPVSEDDSSSSRDDAAGEEPSAEPPAAEADAPDDEAPAEEVPDAADEAPEAEVEVAAEEPPPADPLSEAQESAVDAEADSPGEGGESPEVVEVEPADEGDTEQD